MGAVLLATLGLAILALGLGFPGGPSLSTAGAQDDALVVVSLGDSYTAGNGAGSYYGPAGCYRSSDSYPWTYVTQLEAAGVAAEIWHHACGGAELSEIGAQVDEVPSDVRQRADVVLISIGGNDLGFSTIVRDCLLPTPLLLFCGDRIERALDDLDGVLSGTESVLRAFPTEFPNAEQFVLVGYPDLNSPRCLSPFASEISGAQATYDRSQADLVARLNATPGIRGEATYTHVSLADLYAGRGPCGLGSIAGPSASRWVRYVGEGLPDEWFHPTTNGHDATARLLFGLGLHDPDIESPQTQGGVGYWMGDAGGELYAFGDARDPGSVPGRVVASASTPDGSGLWVLTADGVVHALAGATHHGDVNTTELVAGEAPATISVLPDGTGYWVFTSRGRAISFGTAPDLEDLVDLGLGGSLNGPIIASVATASGRGAYMVGFDGGVFAVGDAIFHGSMGGQRLNGPVVGIAADPDGEGYWLVATDGGIFAFSAEFYGSMGGESLNAPVVGAAPFGGGYLMVASDGGVFNFSDQEFLGSLGNDPPTDPVTTITAYPT